MRCPLQHLAAISVLLAVLFPIGLGASELPLRDIHVRTLSGTSPADNVQWQFARGVFVTAAEQATNIEWSTITVPSTWELEGQGSYSYGRGADRKDRDRLRELSDVGTYRHEFALIEPFRTQLAQRGPDSRRFFLRFDGVLTDTRVFLNGELLKTTKGLKEHRGGFVPFSFDVTDELVLTGRNELIVSVREESSDKSVNRAERDADYWLFGGIFRPVHLLSVPSVHIESVAVDAAADGRLKVVVSIDGLPTRNDVPHTVWLNVHNRRVPRSLLRASASVDQSGQARFDVLVPNPRQWSAARPNLYDLVIAVLRDDDWPALHTTAVPIGFRTLQVRTAPTHQTARDATATGLLVNGERVILRGVNRHSFRPETGRALSPEQNRRDVELIKSLGFNAVRSSHYPPDEAFLDACDELGLYVIDELPGWHDAYDTIVGESILRSMLERDRNHPSILMWANGNEGGWNRALEPIYKELDLQQRPVLRPDSIHGGFDTRHYPTWAEIETMLDPKSPRYRFQTPLTPAPLILPTEMLHALYDGGGAAGLEQYWRRLSESPRFAGGFLWALLDEGVVRVDQPKVTQADGSLRHPIDTAGNYAPDGIVGPYREPSASSRGVRQLFGPQSTTRATRSLEREPWFPDRVNLPGEIGLATTGTIDDGTVTLTRGGEANLAITFARNAAGVIRLHAGERQLPLTGGRWLSSDANRDRPPRLAGEELGEVHDPDLSGETATYTQHFENPKHTIRWTLSQQGLEIEVSAELLPHQAWAGLQFDLDPQQVDAFEWSGLGPDRIWRNRTTGQEGLWQATFPKSESARGAVRSLTSSTLFNGLDTRGLYKTHQSRIQLASNQAKVSHTIELGPGMVGLFRPVFPVDAGLASAALPPGLTIYLRAPGIGTKFSTAEELEPTLSNVEGTLKTTLQFRTHEP